MRKIERISISAADRERLERLVRDRNTPQKVVWRARSESEIDAAVDSRRGFWYSMEPEALSFVPRRLPPFVERWRDRHGKVRVYFRKDRGARIALPPIGSEQFTAAYQTAISGTLAPRREGRVRNAQGTIGALIVS